MKKPTVSSAKKKAWDAVSLYVRTAAADFAGYVMCVTCGVVKHYKQMQAGHFIGGRHNAILFDLRNIHPQCYSCNIGKHGATLEYLDFMKQKYGMKVVNELRRLDRTTKQFTVEELQNIRKTYDELRPI